MRHWIYECFLYLRPGTPVDGPVEFPRARRWSDVQLALERVQSVRHLGQFMLEILPKEWVSPHAHSILFFLPVQSLLVF